MNRIMKKRYLYLQVEQKLNHTIVIKTMRSTNLDAIVHESWETTVK